MDRFSVCGFEGMWGILSISNARVAQLVERDLAKVEAAGSSPVSRSFYYCGSFDSSGFPLFCIFIFM